MDVRAYRWDQRFGLWRWSVHVGGLDGPVLRRGAATNLDAAAAQAADPGADTRRIVRRPDIPVDKGNPEG